MLPFRAFQSFAVLSLSSFLTIFPLSLPFSTGSKRARRRGEGSPLCVALEHLLANVDHDGDAVLGQDLADRLHDRLLRDRTSMLLLRRHDRRNELAQPLVRHRDDRRVEDPVV